MTALLDVNVLVALAWPNHVHHELVTRWFRRQQRHGWATCSTTQSGFVRVSSNPRVLSEAKTPREALALLGLLLQLPHHIFLSDDVSLATSEFVAPRKILGHRQVTDAHLLAISLRHQVRLATLDRGVVQLLPDGASAEGSVWFLLQGRADG